MSTSMGHEQAMRVMAERARNSELRQWQVRKGELLRSGIPMFFSLLNDHVKSNADEFNSSLGLSADSGLQVFGSDLYIALSKKTAPVFLRKVALIASTERVRITTEIVDGLRAPEITVRECLFDVTEDGTIELDRQDFYSFGNGLFSEATARFR